MLYFAMTVGRALAPPLERITQCFVTLRLAVSAPPGGGGVKPTAAADQPWCLPAGGGRIVSRQRRARAAPHALSSALDAGHGRHPALSCQSSFGGGTSSRSGAFSGWNIRRRSRP